MPRMPALFIGHGSPMNAIENNIYSREWKRIGQSLTKPKAILSLSAHWFTKGMKIMGNEKPKMIYDMYGFPRELYEIIYPAPGAVNIAEKVQKQMGDTAEIDDTWGLDHGTWSVLHHLYPQADIPTFQMSINAYASPQEHYEVGKKLKFLRDEGVLILGSGNVVHNLGRVNWDMKNGYDWAEEFDAYIKEKILQRADSSVVQYQQAGKSAHLAFSTMDHFAPLLLVLGAVDEKDSLSVFNDSCVLGSLSMTSYQFN